jgi:HEAT repeat protein
MTKPRGLDAKLSRLHTLRHEPASPMQLAELRNFLRDKSNFVVGEAAEIVGERLLSELTSDLVASFDRFLSLPPDNDKLCRAKLAIVDALNKIEYDREEVFLRALRHVQMEPRWPRAEDSAAPLRASAAFGLVRINYPDVVLLLVDLLTDKEKVARSAAARALGESGRAGAIPVLRLKARMGDKEPEVTADCLTTLMIAAPKESLSFVEQFLVHPDEIIQQGAAFALAESRLPEALEILKGYWPHAQHGSLQEVILLAISMTRLPAALDFLLEILAGDDLPTSQAALSALAIHRHNKPVKDRIAEVVDAKKNVSLQGFFKKKF